MADTDSGGGIVDSIKSALGIGQAKAPQHKIGATRMTPEQYADAAVSGDPTEDATTPSNPGKQAQSSDHQNQY